VEKTLVKCISGCAYENYVVPFTMEKLAGSIFDEVLCKIEFALDAKHFYGGQPVRGIHPLKLTL
jgi:hypothetical protein